jgi:repressor LexA
LGQGEEKGNPALDFRLVFAKNTSMALTPRQKEVLDFILKFSEQHGYSPSFEEIAGGVDLASLATVHKHVSALEQKGYLKRRFNESRSIEVAAEYKQAELTRTRSAGPGEIPLLGRIAAGTPVEAVQNPETLNFADFAGSSETFALQVRGDSMIDDHILSGDYVLVQRTDRVRDGEIVVALVDGTETTLKRLYREPDGRYRLQPANAAMQPILVASDQLQIQGRVLAVLRKYK